MRGHSVLLPGPIGRYIASRHTGRVCMRGGLRSAGHAGALYRDDVSQAHSLNRRRGQRFSYP